MDNVAIVFSSDKNYFPVLEVSLYSLIEHLSHEKTYKLFVLSEDVSEEDVQSLATFLRNAIPTKHFSLELRKTNEVFFSDEKLFYTEIHVSKATYLRFYIPELFSEFSKVLYLDCDLIFFDSIDFLLNFDVEGYCLAAVQDLREEIAREVELKVSGRNWRIYLEKELGMTSKDNYYQAGVLLFNIQKCIVENFRIRCIKRLQEIKRPILSDQDIINSAMRGMIKQLPDAWNVEYQIRAEFLSKPYLEQMPLIRRFKISREKAKILHYSSSQKPWNSIEDPDAVYWWLTARKTRNYEQFILFITKSRRYESIRKLIEKMVNFFFPKGSKRRTILKRLGRNISFKVL